VGKFAEAIRTNPRIEPDLDSAVRRHKMLDVIVRASATGAATESQVVSGLDAKIAWMDVGFSYTFQRFRGRSQISL
jgi:hypothetical protein